MDTCKKKIKENNKSTFFNQSPKLHVINKNSMTSTKMLKNTPEAPQSHILGKSSMVATTLILRAKAKVLSQKRLKMTETAKSPGITQAILFRALRSKSRRQILTEILFLMKRQSPSIQKAQLLILTTRIQRLIRQLTQM